MQANHHSMVGSREDPPDGKAVAGSIFAAVVVYAVRLHSFPPNPPGPLTPRHAYNALQVFLVFCGLQAYLHVRQSKKGAISLR